MAALQAPAAEVKLQAGVARVEITPASLMPMYGYTARKCGPATGTHDPLFAKVLVLATGDTRVAIVTMDLGNLVSDTLARDIAEKLNIPLTLLAASHSHSTPAFLKSKDGENLPGAPYLKELEEKIFGAVRQAAGSMFPARLSAGRGSIQLGYNRLAAPRRRPRPGGLQQHRPRALRPRGPRIRAAAGGGRERRRARPAGALCLPRRGSRPHELPLLGGLPRRHAGARRDGAARRRSACSCRAARATSTRCSWPAPATNRRTSPKWPRWATCSPPKCVKTNRTLRPAGSPNRAHPLRPEKLKFADRWEKGATLDVGITTVLINGEIAIAAVPGEPLHKLQTMWKAQADAAWPLFYGYTYSGEGAWPGYIPDLRSAAYRRLRRRRFH